MLAPCGCRRGLRIHGASDLQARLKDDHFSARAVTNRDDDAQLALGDVEFATIAGMKSDLLGRVRQQFVAAALDTYAPGIVARYKFQQLCGFWRLAWNFAHGCGDPARAKRIITLQAEVGHAAASFPLGRRPIGRCGEAGNGEREQEG